MNSVDQRSLFTSRAPNRVFFLLFFFGFMFVSGWRWSIISSSTVSLFFTLPVLVSTHDESARFLRVDLLEYWIAAFVWILTFAFFFKTFLKSLIGQRHLSPSGNDNQGSPSPFESRGLGKGALAAFAFVALTAPFLAPFQPSSQGDLTSTRLLKPLEKAIVTESTELTIGGEPPTAIPNALVRNLEKANLFLLGRQEKFVRFTGSPVSGDRVARTQVRTFLLGTDDLGRDVLSRLIYGTRISLGIGFSAMLCTIFIGCLIGFIAGVCGRWVDKLLMRLTDLFLAFPTLFLVIALVAFFGSSTILLIVLLSATGWMSVARLVRGETLVLKEREFILSARLLGRSSIQILRTHMLPNVTPTILVACVLQLGNVILAEAALSFLGLGVQPPTPSWGNMIGESMGFLDSAWWVGVFPGAALSLVVVSANLAAQRLERSSSTLE
jgi:peptide/nickel transport system permease protein